ncbi:low temperature requirement protein A [Desulfobulbus sp. F1]|nr:low temperature requirement protein A [Desulfobulbus sp. F1]
MAKRILWELPTLNYKEEQGEHRKVTWLELFFDLFFVASIAQISHGLHEHLSWQGAVEFSMLFIPAWWIWIGFTNYNERFESNGLEIRLFTFLLMLPVIGLSVFAHHGVQEGFQGIVLSYTTARLILTLLWMRAVFHIPLFRPTGSRFIIGFIISAALSLPAAFIGTYLGFWLFAAALCSDLLTPLTTAVHQMKLPRLSSSKRPERFGLLVLIVLGEMVVGVVNGLAEVRQLTLPLFLEASLGVALGFGFWWIYFDFIGRRPPKSGTGWGFAWGYLHLPLVMAIAAAGAGISSAIGRNDLLAVEVRQLVAVAIGCALIAMALLELTLRRGKDEPTHPVLSPTLKLLAGLLSTALGWTESIVGSPLAFLLVLFALVACQMIYGLWVWFGQELNERVQGS